MLVPSPACTRGPLGLAPRHTWGLSKLAQRWQNLLPYHGGRGVSAWVRRAGNLGTENTWTRSAALGAPTPDPGPQQCLRTPSPGHEVTPSRDRQPLTLAASFVRGEAGPACARGDSVPQTCTGEQGVHRAPAVTLALHFTSCLTVHLVKWRW